MQLHQLLVALFFELANGLENEFEKVQRLPPNEV